MIAPFFVFPWLLIPIGAFVPDPFWPDHTILTGNKGLLVGQKRPLLRTSRLVDRGPT